MKRTHHRTRRNHAPSDIHREVELSLKAVRQAINPNLTPGEAEALYQHLLARMGALEAVLNDSTIAQDSPDLPQVCKASAAVGKALGVLAAGMKRENPHRRRSKARRRNPKSVLTGRVFPARSYLRRFFDEKEVPERTFSFVDSQGLHHDMPNAVVLEAIAQTQGQERTQIESMLRRIDFANGDVNHFLAHLARGLAEQYKGVVRNPKGGKKRRNPGDVVFSKPATYDGRKHIEARRSDHSTITGPHIRIEQRWGISKFGATKGQRLGPTDEYDVFLVKRYGQKDLIGRGTLREAKALAKRTLEAL